MKNKFALVLVLLIVISLAFISGWFVRGGISDQGECKSSPLRLGGFEFVRPLLICNTNAEKSYPELKPLERELENIIDKEKKVNNISAASVYFQDFKTDGRIDINKDEKFHSASIGKVPIMIAIYKLAESNPAILFKKVRYEGGIDGNSEQEIQPKDYPKIGETYTVDELIEKMIKYSDNISPRLLVSFVKPNTIVSLYRDFQVPLRFDPQNPEDFDFITTKDISYFFRVLYNATYLTSELSEKALNLLSRVDYKNGLVAGVPAGVAVAHKFGLVSIEEKGVIVERELNDCGIIYHPRNPYLLCVMTRSPANIPNIENVIKDISAAAYEYVDSH